MVLSWVSGFVLHVVPDVWGTYYDVVCGWFRAPHSQFGEEARPRLWMDEWNRPQAIELDPSCSRQTQSNSPGNGYGYESAELGCALLVLRVVFIILPLKTADASPAKLFHRFRTARTNGCVDLSLFRRVSENQGCQLLLPRIIYNCSQINLKYKKQSTTKKIKLDFITTFKNKTF